MTFSPQAKIFWKTVVNIVGSGLEIGFLGPNSYFWWPTCPKKGI
jgi:hypothetical protein